MTDAKGNVYTGKTDKNGLFKAENIACGTFDILFDEGSDEFTPLETVANNPVLQDNPDMPHSPPNISPSTITCTKKAM